MPGSHDPIYLKFWVYVPSSFTVPYWDGGYAGTAAEVARLFNIPAYTRYEFALANTCASSCPSPVNLYVNAGSNVGTMGSNGTNIVTRDAWNSIEIEYNVGAGTITEWLNGTQDITLTGQTLPSTMNNVMLGLAQGTGSVYFDDVTVSDTYSGNPSSNVTVRHAYPGNRVKMKIQTYLWGEASTDVLVSSIDGTAFSTITNPGGYQEPILNVSALSAGNHTLLVALKNSGSSTRSSWTETLAASGAVPTVGIDENNNLVVGGHKIFPVTGWFTNQGSGLYWLQQGYTNAGGWVSPSAATYDESQYQTYCDTYHGYGRVAGPMSTRMSVAGGVPDYAAYASTMTSDDCVLAWSTYDEPSVNGWTVSQMQRDMNNVHANDNNHPVIMDDAIVPGLNLNWYYPTLVADIYASDTYALCNANNSSPGATAWLAGLDQIPYANYSLVPQFDVIDFYRDTVDSHCADITATTIYNEAWLSVIHGRKGVSWYDNGSEDESDYGPVCSGSAQSCFVGSPSTHAGKFVSQVAAITPDSLLAGPGPNNRTVISNQTTNVTPGAVGTRVDASVSDDGTNTWIFAARVTDLIVNSGDPSASDLSTTLTISPAITGTATVYGESRTVSVVGGALTDNFSPYGVHLYWLADTTTPIPNRITSGKVTRTGRIQ
jgi:hypothetical protein